MAMLKDQRVSSLIRLETKPDGSKLLMPIRPIACVSGIMDLGHAVIRMLWAVDFAAELALRLLIVVAQGWNNIIWWYMMLH